MSAMPARDAEHQSADLETAPEVAPAEPEAAKADFTTEGDLPAVAQTSATATAVTASELAFGAPVQQEDTTYLDHGIHHWEDYKAGCEAAGKPEKWKDYYRAGHTEAAGWTQPYEHRKVYDFELKRSTSASRAIQDFVKGPTIADYRVAGVANDLDELRDDFGDQKFDRLFGSANDNEDSSIPDGQRLHISPALYSIPLIDQMKAIAAQEDAKATPNQDEQPAPIQEARVEEKPKASLEQEQEPVVIAQELGMQQADRELV